jgi:hypothetical protein
MPSPNGIVDTPWAGTISPWLVLGLAACCALALVVLVLSDRFWDVRVGRGVDEPGAGIRLVAVHSTPDGIVVDGLVDHGWAMGVPGSPITLLLEPLDHHDVAVAELRRDAADNRILEVDVDHPLAGAVATADLGRGLTAMRLPVLAIRP